MEFPIGPALRGFVLSIGLIVAIGLQNSYILRQGVLGRHVFLVAFICAVCDIGLIAVGAMGVGGFIAKWTLAQNIMVWLGAGFMIWYGIKSWRDAAKGGYLASIKEDGKKASLSGVVLTTLGFSLLNPQALTETIMLIGGVAGQYDVMTFRFSFAVGAALASIVWFFGLAFGAKIFGPYLRKPVCARCLDLAVGALMFWIAGTLIYSSFHPSMVEN